MRLILQPEATTGAAPYEHLIPIVRCLLANGNRPFPSMGGNPRDALGFYMDRDGWRCDLAKPINFGLVGQSFILPNSIELHQESDSIVCRRSWIQVSGSVG